MPKIKPVKTLWKSMRAGMTSSYGNVEWKIGEWQTEKGQIATCNRGFHASENIIDAILYVNCEVLALVEVAGKSSKESDKEAWEKMRIVKAYKWDKEASVKLAIFAAESVIQLFEKRSPNDDRPRKAIEAAKAYLEAKTDKERSAACAAARAAYAAAYAACAAANAAYAAAYAADAAANAACAAACAAANAACAAAYAADAAACAADAAARAAFKQSCHDFIVNEVIPTLKPYEDS